MYVRKMNPTRLYYNKNAPTSIRISHVLRYASHSRSRVHATRWKGSRQRKIRSLMSLSFASYSRSDKSAPDLKEDLADFELRTVLVVRHEDVRTLLCPCLRIRETGGRADGGWSLLQAFHAEKLCHSSSTYTRHQMTVRLFETPLSLSSSRESLSFLVIDPWLPRCSA